MAQIGVGDDAVREACAIGRFLEPFGFLDRVLGPNGRLDMHGFGDVNVGVANLGDVILSDVITFGKFLYLIAERWVRNTRLPVGVVQLWMLHIVVVDVGVYEVNYCHNLASSAAGSQPIRLPFCRWRGGRHITVAAAVIDDANK